MSIKAQCPNCSGKFKAPDNAAGRRVKCPFCEARITVAAPSVPSAKCTPPANNISELLAEGVTPKSEPFLPPLENSSMAALGIDNRSMYSVGTTLAPRRTPGTGPTFSVGGGFSAFDFVSSHKFILMVFGFSAASFLMLLHYDRPIHAVVQGSVGILFALGAWRSQSLGRSRTVAAENWRSLEHIVGLILILLFAGLVTFVTGMRIYAIFDTAVPKVGMNSHVVGYLTGTVMAWVIMIGICSAIYRASETYGFFRPGGWVYVAYFFIVWILAATGNLNGTNRDDGEMGGVEKPASNSLTPESSAANTPSMARPMPDRPTFREILPGVLSGDVNLNIPRGTPGFAGQLYIYLPKGDHAHGSLGCVFIAAAGGTSISGTSLGPGDRAEHIPYAQAGFAVVAYETDGERASDRAQLAKEAATHYREYVAADAGLVNARNAIEFALSRIPEIDPHKLYAVGHSSAAKLALLLAEADPRIKACVAYAPVTDELARHAGKELWNAPGPEKFQDFLVRTSPRTRESELNCPVFLFHAEDDSVVSVSQTRDFAERLKSMGKPITVEIVPSGNHYDSMIRSGIPKGIAWLCALEGRKVPSKPQRSAAPPKRPFVSEPQGELPVANPATPPIAEPQPQAQQRPQPAEPPAPITVTIGGTELKPKDKLEYRRSSDEWEPVEFVGPGPANTVLILRKDLKHAMPVPIDRLRLPGSGQ